MLKLSDKDRQVLAAIELRARSFVPEIQKLTGLKAHTIRYCLEGFFEKKILTPQVFVDIYPLGQTHVFCYLSAGFEKKDSRAKLIAYLSSSPQVTWLAELTGEYQFELGLKVSNLNQALDYLYSIPAETGVVFTAKELVCRTGMTLYPRKHLHASASFSAPLSYGASGGSISLSELERNILACFGKQPLASHREIANLLQVSPAAVDLRVKELKAKGVIKGFWYLIDSERIGRSMHYIRVYARGFDTALKQTLYKIAAEHPDIVAIHEGFGSWDYSMLAETESGKALSQLLDLIQQKAGQNINSLRVVTRLQVLNCNMFP